MQVLLNHLKHFVVVAEELHFGRAAARLHMAQPPLSHQVRQLEREIKVELFSRHNKKVSLTAAGEVFLARSRQLLLDLDESVLQAQRAHRGETGTLVVGTIPAGVSHLFTVILPTFRARHPQVQLTVRTLSTAGQLAALHNGDIDMAVLRLPISDPRIDIRGVVSDPLLVVLPSHHPLASQPEIELAAIAEVPQVIFPRAFAPDYYDLIQGLFKSIGATLPVAQVAEDIQTHFGLIAGGFGIGLFPHASQMRYADIAMIPLTRPRVLIETGIGFLRGRETPLISDFLAIASQAAKAGSPAPAAE
jgi:DNA-binding transcriptional LysR family regulator